MSSEQISKARHLLYSLLDTVRLVLHYMQCSVLLAVVVTYLFFYQTRSCSTSRCV